ncbi:MAG: hypothetical protein DRN15_05510 [Thermoprotei archaeon]|nr:MAG: hypothetical protein DRN15_05510 [Thermoprotei archaeon]
MGLDLVSMGEIIVDFIPINDMTYQACFGGAPMNCAIACSRLGLKVGVITSIGEDAFGRFLLETLKAHGVDTRRVRVAKGRRTTLAFVVKLPEGEREFFFYRRPWSVTADTELALGGEDREYILSSKILHISGFALSQEPARSEIFKALDWAMEGDVKVSLDPTFRPDVWRSIDEARKVYAKVLGKVNLLLATLRECEVLFKVKKVKEILNEVANVGIELFGLKMGAKGALLYDGEKAVFMEPYQVEVKDTVGAGDAWNAGIIYGYLRKLDLEDMLRLANAVAAIKCMHVGAITGLPTIEEVERFIKSRARPSTRVL